MERSRSLNQVEKVSYPIYSPCWGLELKFHVKLGTPDIKTKKKRGHHSEFIYNSQTYSDLRRLITMRLDYTPYLTLETKKNKYVNTKEGVYIGIKHIHHFINGLKEVREWFYDDKFQKLFLMSGNTLILNREFRGETVNIGYLGNGKWIRIRPNVIEKDEEQYEGLVIYLNGPENQYFMTLDEFDSFYEIITNFNLFQSGQLAVNYLQRPELGEYEIDMDAERMQPTESGESVTASKGMRGRMVGQQPKNDLDSM